MNERTVELLLSHKRAKRKHTSCQAEMQTNEVERSKQSRGGQSRSSVEISVMEMEQRTLTD